MPVQIPERGVLLGLGCDIVEAARISGVLERQGARFLERVFTPEERAYCMGMKNPAPHLAARFAAKEAVSKAFGTGIGAELGWTSVEIVHGPRKEPLVVLDEKGAALLRSMGGTGVMVSLSHDAGRAMAVAAVVGKAE